MRGYRVLLILGLLYHLTLEDQIELLSRCPADSEVVVDTQVHIPELVVHGASAARSGFAYRPASHEGYSGVIFPEVTNPMASIGNNTSWWHTEPSLVKLFQNAGFMHITEVAPPYTTEYGARRWYLLKNESA